MADSLTKDEINYRNLRSPGSRPRPAPASAAEDYIMVVVVVVIVIVVELFELCRQKRTEF
jgi:hypothetical protein